MQSNNYQVFVTMFHALDASYDDVAQTERLRSFLSEANPYLWKDRGSADPAVFSEFSTAFNKRFPSGKAEPEEAASFVRDYLAEQNNVYTWVEGDLVEAFDSVVAPELWEQELAKAEV